MKHVLIFLACFTIGCLWAEKEKAKTDLEIYTKDNIYYIEGLKVTNENGDEVLIFGNKKELKEYISKLTINSIKN